MERRQQEAAMEAVLFAMGESVEIGKLAEVIEEDEDTARQIINEMKENGKRREEAYPLRNLRIPSRCAREGICMNTS